MNAACPLSFAAGARSKMSFTAASQDLAGVVRDAGGRGDAIE
jgi:hypothetical protein